MAPASKRQKLGRQLAKSRQQEADDGTDASSCDENTPQPLSASSSRRNAPRDTTRAELARRDAEIHTLKTRVLELEREVQRVEDVEHELEALQGSYNALEEKRQQLYVEKRNLDKAKRRAEEDLREETRSHTKRSATVRQLESELTSARAKIASHTIHIQSLQSSLKAKQDTITAVRQQLYAAEKREKTAKSSLAKLQKEYDRVRVWRPKEKGVFRPQWRSLARDLVGAGVPLAKLRLVAESFARTVGVEIKGKFMSARTGARVVDEGGLLGELQNARELLDCDGFTEATDGTGYRGITYEGHHNTLRAPTYAPGVDDTDKSTWKVQTRFVNVTNSVSHTAEAQFRGIRKTAERLADLYNRSPFSEQDARTMDKGRLLPKEDGRESGPRRGWQEGIQDFGRVQEAYCVPGSRKEGDREREIFDDAEIQLATLGVDDMQLCEYHEISKEELQKLPAEEVSGLRRRIVERRFGERRFEFLTDDQKKNALTSVFGGCCAHKELNVVRIAYAHVKKFYADYGLAPPVLLANKANDSILQLGTNDSGLTNIDSAAIKKALDASTCGAIKLLQLMSSLLKNKDIERGYQLRTTMYMQREKKELYDLEESGEITSVSTNRYGSFTRSASEALCFHTSIYTLIEEIVDAKTKSGQLNHVEKNVLKGLDCPATMTECAALAFLGACVGQPYLGMVRGRPGQPVNLIDLTDLHRRIPAFCRHIADHPYILLDPSTPLDQLTLDGRPMRDHLLIPTVQMLRAELPHIFSVISTIFAGAAEGWVHFNPEFREGGTFDQLTEWQHEIVYLLSANDPSEGVLGETKIDIRENPNGSIETFSSKKRVKKNNTEAFARKCCNGDVQGFVRKEARKGGKSGRKREFYAKWGKVQHQKSVAGVQKRQTAAARKAALNAKYAAIKLELSLVAIEKMTGAELTAQLHCYRDVLGDEVLLAKRWKDDDMRLVLLQKVLVKECRLREIARRDADPSRAAKFDGTGASSGAESSAQDDDDDWDDDEVED
ncbi:hypothetical protein MKEN_00057200 [Mycena kentingensis (nom. inval.)]|nr:hypothetical protein MKEN_00057200 [Mycena kentingensis (nom. inval.)]